jgi:hypothetical protein
MGRKRADGDQPVKCTHTWSDWFKVTVESLVTGTVGLMFKKTCKHCDAVKWKNL